MTRILLVEDHDLNRYVLTKLLTKIGFSVVQAVNGAQSIEKLANEQVAVILMDMNLPDMNGWEVVAFLKASPYALYTPIIGLSAHDDSAIYAKAIASGCDDYDTKPIDLARLTRKITKLIPHESVPTGAHAYLAC